MQKKKSRFWSFIWSFLPGAAHMYLGFMKMGVSLMLGFLILCGVVGFTNIDVLLIFPIAMYIYSFFHANNLATLNDEEFYTIKDQYLLGLEGLDSIEKIHVSIVKKYRKVTALILIVIGLIMLWDIGFDMLVDIFGWDNPYLAEVSYFMNYQMPRMVIAIAVIWIGIVLIRGKKVEYVEEDQETAGKQDGYSTQGITNEQTVSVEQNISDGRENQ